MLKLMKYEFRKMRTPLLIMLAMLAVLEIGYVIGDRIDDYRVIGVCLGLLTALVFAVYLYILVSGIVSYSRELNNKTGYLTFMMPVSPAEVVASKLLFTMLAALVVAALFGASIYFDYAREFHKLNMNADTYRQLDFTFTMLTGGMGGNITLTQVLLRVAEIGGRVLISILTLLCTAYLAITLSATLLQNKRGFLRGLLSFILFVLLQYATSKLSGEMVSGAADTLQETGALLGKALAIEAACCLVFAGASAVLLDRKVSL
ncbi:MAG: hypothetical protein IJJ45_06840 [Clostridia bacterium]|nr:hypothetical protein [Clostridia bacterium]